MQTYLLVIQLVIVLILFLCTYFVSGEQVIQFLFYADLSCALCSAVCYYLIVSRFNEYRRH